MNILLREKAIQNTHLARKGNLKTPNIARKGNLESFEKANFKRLITQKCNYYMPLF